MGEEDRTYRRIDVQRCESRDVQTYGVFHKHSHHTCICSHANHFPEQWQTKKESATAVVMVCRRCVHSVLLVFLLRYENIF